MIAIRDFYHPALLEFDAAGDIAGAQELIQKLKGHIDRSYKRPEGMYARARALVGSGVREKEITKALRLTVRQSQKEYSKTREEGERRVEHRNSNQTVFTLEYVSSVVGILRPGITFADKVILLMLSSGARKIEILDASVSDFTFSADGETHLVQHGFAKKGRLAAITSISKPIIFLTSHRFLALLHEVRVEVAQRGKRGRVEIGKSFSHQLEKRSSDLWPQNLANGYRTGTHINRAIYANVAYLLHGAPDESLAHFIKHVLGHESMGTASSYMNVAIAREGDVEMNEKADELEENVDRQEVILESDDGESLLAFKPSTQKMTQEEREAKTIELGKWLKSVNMPVTRALLMKLGCQSKVITSSGVLDQ